MVEEKKSFVLYTDLHHTVEKLTDEKAGILFKHILKYVNDLHPETDDLLIQIAFEPIKQQLKRDLKHWEKVRAKRSESGKLGGRPKKENEDEKAKKANGLFEKQKKQTKAKKAVNVNVNVNGNVINNKEGEKIKSNEETFDYFWDQYHKITLLPKTDKEAAFKYWIKMKLTEQQLAYKNINSYFNSLSDSKYCKKARTYLADKNFNDEFNSIEKTLNGFKYLTDEEKQRKGLNHKRQYIWSDIDGSDYVGLRSEEEIKAKGLNPKDNYTIKWTRL